MLQRRGLYRDTLEEQNWNNSTEKLMSHEEDGEECLFIKSAYLKSEPFTILIPLTDEHHKKRLPVEKCVVSLTCSYYFFAKIKKINSFKEKIIQVKSNIKMQFRKISPESATLKQSMVL